MLINVLRSNVSHKRCCATFVFACGITRTTRTPVLWDTPRRPMITHQIPSHNKTESKLHILKHCQKFKFVILQETLNATHLLKSLDKMCKHVMDPTRTVGVTERAWDAGQTDGRTDGQTDGRNPKDMRYECLGFQGGRGTCTYQWLTAIPR